MNYYIQGNAAKADKIKAAFEAKGCVMHTGIQCDLSDMIYFSLNGKVGGIKLRNLDLFKTHPDYKELELPVEPKFKVGDTIKWINHDYDAQTITDIRDGSYITVDKYGVRCALKFVNQDEWELAPKPHYDIANFHAGMPVLVRDYDNSRWSYVQFSHYVGEECGFKFNACGIPYIQCIPFNEETKHLLGTTDMPDECYINW